MMGLALLQGEGVKALSGVFQLLQQLRGRRLAYIMDFGLLHRQGTHVHVSVIGQVKQFGIGRDAFNQPEVIYQWDLSDFTDQIVTLRLFMKGPDPAS